jgi:hypothetical protein
MPQFDKLLALKLISYSEVLQWVNFSGFGLGLTRFTFKLAILVIKILASQLLLSDPAPI